MTGDVFRYAACARFSFWLYLACSWFFVACGVLFSAWFALKMRLVRSHRGHCGDGTV